jgi:hypothetical protein
MSANKGNLHKHKCVLEQIATLANPITFALAAMSGSKVGKRSGASSTSLSDNHDDHAQPAGKRVKRDDNNRQTNTVCYH